MKITAAGQSRIIQMIKIKRKTLEMHSPHLFPNWLVVVL